MRTFILSFTFVVLYGSGFVATQVGVPYVDPLSFLILRFLITSVILFFICLLFKVRWPASLKDLIHQSIAGVLIVGVFSVGVFVSIDLGTPAATSALIISLQPILASFISFLLMSTSVSRSQWLGLMIGFSGVTFIVSSNLGFTSASGIAMSFFGLFGLAFGSVYQKKFCSGMNVFSGGFIHVLASFLFCVILSFFYGERHVEWNFSFVSSLLWMSVVVSIGALNVFYLLIRDLEISRVSSLFYLVPVGSVLMSFIVFDLLIGWVELVGILITSIAVFLVNSNFFRFRISNG